MANLLGGKPLTANACSGRIRASKSVPVRFVAPKPHTLLKTTSAGRESLLTVREVISFVQRQSLVLTV